MGGLSPLNLLAMKLFAQAFPKPEFTQQPVAKLPWGHIIKAVSVEPGFAESARLESRIKHNLKLLG